eukprot:tig00000449_g940.t1
MAPKTHYKSLRRETLRRHFAIVNHRSSHVAGMLQNGYGGGDTRSEQLRIEALPAVGASRLLRSSARPDAAHGRYLLRPATHRPVPRQCRPILPAACTRRCPPASASFLSPCAIRRCPSSRGVPSSPPRPAGSQPAPLIAPPLWPALLAPAASILGAPCGCGNRRSLPPPVA